MKKIFRNPIMYFLVLCLIFNVFFIPAGAEGKTVKITFPHINKEDTEFSFLEEKTENKIVFTENGTTDFKISMPGETTRAFDRAVYTLIDTVHEMSGAEIEIAKKDSAGGRMIYLDGASDADIADVKYDGFVISVEDNGINIKGRDMKASANGIYYFIEEYLGAMFITHDDTFITKHKNIYLEKSFKVCNPAMEWRDVYAYETGRDFWSAKLKLNSLDAENDDSEIFEKLSPEQKQNLSDYDAEKRIIEMRQYDGWHTWCHSMYTYLSPDEYFDEHPEYFSMKDGERVHTYGDRDAHLCLSNPEVYNIVEKKMAEMMAENPDELYWDFSCNDNSGVAGCECEECRKLDEAAGGTGMGTLLPFINKLAQRFPDKYISTLAYLHTLKAPSGEIKAEKNVVIKLCSMPGDQASSYLNPGNSGAETFNKEVCEWGRIADKIIVWDYVVNFANLLLPFPNFAVQQENQKFYEDNKVSGVFHQASREKGGELADMRAYVLSKLMWEGSSMDVAETVSRYCCAFYGDAAEAVIEYLNLLAENSALHKDWMGMYEDPFSNYNGYLSHSAIEQYKNIIAGAAKSVDSDSVYADRVGKLELNLLYAGVHLPELGKETRNADIKKLKTLCGRYDITMAREWEDLDSFIKNLPGQIASYNRTLKKPYYILTGSISGVIITAAAVLIIVKIIRKKKSAKS